MPKQPEDLWTGECDGNKSSAVRPSSVWQVIVGKLWTNKSCLLILLYLDTAMSSENTMLWFCALATSASRFCLASWFRSTPNANWRISVSGMRGVERWKRETERENKIWVVFQCPNSTFLRRVFVPHRGRDACLALSSLFPPLPRPVQMVICHQHRKKVCRTKCVVYFAGFENARVDRSSGLTRLLVCHPPCQPPTK